MEIWKLVITHGFALLIGAVTVAIIASKEINRLKQPPKYTIPRDAIHTNL